MPAVTVKELRDMAFQLENMAQATGNIAVEEHGIWDAAEQAFNEACHALRVAAKYQQEIQKLESQ